MFRSGFREPLRLTGKLLLLASPLVVLAIAYVWFDPFRVLYRYENFYDPPTAVTLNGDYVSTELFVRNAERYGYDTLIFGNSRALAYRVADLKHLLGSDIRPFHFETTEESLFGVHAKARLVHELGTHLRYVLIVLDAQLLGVTANDPVNHLKIKDPRLSGDSRLAFQLAFVRAYFSGFFAPMYLHHRLIGHTLPYMTALQTTKPPAMPENEINLSNWETEIERDGIDAYIARRRSIFVPRTPSTGSPVIHGAGLRMLTETADWLHEAGAQVDVVVSPLYDQVRLAHSDRLALEAVFGREHVHDFSGLNAITQDVTNYYETSHYRPRVGAQILDDVYGSHVVDRRTDAHD